MPSSPRPARLPTATARSACASVRRASSRKIAPAGVSATERGPRDNSWALNRGFERLDLRAQGRLRDPQPVGRASEVQLLGERHEVAELAQFH